VTTAENGATAAADRWWPSPFGPDDELGMLNHVDDGKRLEALALVRRGRMYDLGRVLDEHVPVFPGRFFRQTLVTTAHHTNGDGGVGENRVNWITEQVTATQQLGTHLDALSHLQVGDRGSASRACRRSSRAGGWSTFPPAAASSGWSPAT
jgi:hypothetical protein